MPRNRIGILTGGGDCPGLNAVIRALTLEAARLGVAVTGVLDGFAGLAEDRTRELGPDDVGAILTQGGSILGCSNRADPRRFVLGKDDAGGPVFGNVVHRCLATLGRRGIGTLFVIGGDGTMSCAAPFAAGEGAGPGRGGGGDVGEGVNVIGIPKTIDNDLHGTDLTFGFLTAVATATDAMDRLHTTAASHHRAMVVEVMGRNAGWLALHAGVAAAADVILIPEIPWTFEAVAAAVKARCEQGRRYSIVCVSEGAKPVGGSVVVSRMDPCATDPVRLGGIGRAVSEGIERLTGIDSRDVVLGHVQRGGGPVASDRVLATRFGHHAMELFQNGARHRMVAWQAGTLTDVPVTEAADRQRLVPAGDPLVRAARAVGVRFGD